ncbi:MAG TPA: hypothetical protein VGJ92_08975 [Methanocella sp.]
MSDEAFQRETIDRLARIETRQEEIFSRQDVIFGKIDEIMNNCRAEDDRYDGLAARVIILETSQKAGNRWADRVIGGVISACVALAVFIATTVWGQG